MYEKTSPPRFFLDLTLNWDRLLSVCDWHGPLRFNFDMDTDHSYVELRSIVVCIWLTWTSKIWFWHRYWIKIILTFNWDRLLSVCDWPGHLIDTEREAHAECFVVRPSPSLLLYVLLCNTFFHLYGNLGGWLENWKRYRISFNFLNYLPY